MRIVPSPAQYIVLDSLITGHEFSAQPNTWTALRIRGWVSDEHSITPEGLLAMNAPNAFRTTAANVVQNLTRYGPATLEVLARRLQTHPVLLRRTILECDTLIEALQTGA